MNRRQRRHFSIAVLSAAAQLGCVPPVPTPAPEPAPLSVALAPERVVQRAAAFAIAEGFDVVASDAPAGVFAARRGFRGAHASPYYRCRWPKGSSADLSTQVAYTINVSAAERADSSIVRIRGNTASIVGALAALGQGASSEDCVPTGALEAKLSDALRR